MEATIYKMIYKNEVKIKEETKEKISQNNFGTIRELNFSFENTNNNLFNPIFTNQFNPFKFPKQKIKKKIKDYNLKILGKEFVKNNKNKTKLIIDNKRINLK